MANSERFLADRAAPLCGLGAGKSFGQLRSCVLYEGLPISSDLYLQL